MLLTSKIEGPDEGEKRPKSTVNIAIFGAYFVSLKDNIQSKKKSDEIPY